MPNPCADTHHGNHELSQWRVTHMETLLRYNADLLAGRTPEYMVADQFEGTQDDPDIRTWVDAYLSFNPADPGDDPVFGDAGRALTTAIVHDNSDDQVVGAILLANHFTRAQYATFTLNQQVRPDDTTELSNVYTRSSSEVLQMMTDLAFDADANGLALSALPSDTLYGTEKWWIDLFANCINLVTDNNGPMPVCVIDPMVGLLVAERAVVRSNLSAFRRPMLAMITDSLWMLVTTHER